MVSLGHILGRGQFDSALWFLVRSIISYTCDFFERICIENPYCTVFINNYSVNKTSGSVHEKNLIS